MAENKIKTKNVSTLSKKLEIKTRGKICFILHDFAFTMKFPLLLGSGCGTSVEHTPRDRVVVGSNPAGCWAFFFSSLSYQECVLNQVPHGGATLLIYL